MKTKSMKRLFAIMMAGVIGLSLVGCGSNSSSSNEGNSDTSSESTSKGEDGTKGDIVLSLAFNAETSDPAYENDIVPIFEEFMKLHPEVAEIKFTGMGKMTEDQQVTRLTGGQYDDVLLIPMGMPNKERPNFFASLGDATELGEKYFYGDFIQSDGETYALPIGVVYEGLVYNKKVLDECYGGKVPTTLDELLEACEAIKATGKTPFYTNAGAEWPLRFWDNLAITASETPDYANTLVSSTAPWADDEALHFSSSFLANLAANDMVEPDTVTEQWDNSRISVATGESAFMLLGTWALPQVKDVAEEMGEDPDNISFMPFPYKNGVSADNKLNLRVSEDIFMGVNKNSENLELAKELLVFFCENISLSRGMNEIMREGGRNVEDLQFLQDLDYIEFYSSPARTEEFEAISSTSKIDVFSVGSYLQDNVIQPAINGEAPKFDALNERWAAEIN